MKRLWIATAILVLLFSSSLLSAHYLAGFTAELAALLTQAEVRAEAGDWTAAAALTTSALDRWHTHDDYLYVILRHSDADAVYVGFRAAQEFINCREDGEYSAANAELITQIELLAEAEQFSLKNLF